MRGIPGTITDPAAGTDAFVPANTGPTERIRDAVARDEARKAEATPEPSDEVYTFVVTVRVEVTPSDVAAVQRSLADHLIRLSNAARHLAPNGSGSGYAVTAFSVETL